MNTPQSDKSIEESIGNILDDFYAEAKNDPLQEAYGFISADAIKAINALISTQLQKQLDELESKLPEEIEEGDGWDIHFSNGKEKGKVRPCCPGDDIAYVHNQLRTQIRTAIQAMRESL